MPLIWSTSNCGLFFPKIATCLRRVFLILLKSSDKHLHDTARRRLNLFLYSLKSSDKHLHDRHGKKTTELVVAKNCLGKLSRCYLMIKTGDFDFEQIQIRGIKELLCRCHRVYVKNKIMSPALSYDNLSNAILNLWPTN